MVHYKETNAPNLKFHKKTIIWKHYCSKEHILYIVLFIFLTIEFLKHPVLVLFTNNLLKYVMSLLNVRYAVHLELI